MTGQTATPATPSTPAAAATPATPVPAPAPAPATPQTGGFLDNIKISATSPASNPQEAPPATPAAAPATPATPEAPATEDGTTPDPATPPATEPPASKYTVLGREYTGDELAKALEHSSTEGRKIPALTEQVKRYQAQVTAAEAKYAELQAKLDETPPYKVLTKEEIKELPSDEQLEYILKRDKWEDGKATRKEALAKAQEAQAAADAELTDYVYARTTHMSQNTTAYPGYNELVPVMEEIMAKAPHLGGTKETPDLLYYAALGLKTHREGKMSKEAETKAKADAAAQAAAAAAAAGGGNAPAPVGGTIPNEDSDEALNAKLIKSAPNKSIFK